MLAVTIHSDFELILYCFITVSGGNLTTVLSSSVSLVMWPCSAEEWVEYISQNPLMLGLALWHVSANRMWVQVTGCYFQARALLSCEPLREEHVPCGPRRMWRHTAQNWNQKCWLLAQEIQSMKQSHPTWPANTGQKEKLAAVSHSILGCLLYLILTTKYQYSIANMT